MSRLKCEIQWGGGRGQEQESRSNQTLILGAGFFYHTFPIKIDSHNLVKQNWDGLTALGPILVFVQCLHSFEDGVCL